MYTCMCISTCIYVYIRVVRLCICTYMTVYMHDVTHVHIQHIHSLTRIYIRIHSFTLQLDVLRFLDVPICIYMYTALLTCIYRVYTFLFCGSISSFSSTYPHVYTCTQSYPYTYMCIHLLTLRLNIVIFFDVPTCIYLYIALPTCIYVYTPSYLAAQYRHSFRRNHMYICTQSYPHVYRCICLLPFGSICHFLRRTHMYIPVHSLTHMYIGVYASYLAAGYRRIPQRIAGTLIAFLENLV